MFFQPWWLDVVCKKWDVAIVEKEGKLLAVWPYSIEKKIGVTIIRNPLLTPYLGPYFFEENINEKEVLELLWAQFPKWDFFDVQCLPEFTNHAFFESKGFSSKKRTTYIIELSPSEEILYKNISNSRRSRIRKAENDLKIGGGINDLDVCYHLHKKTFIDKKLKYPFPQTVFLNLLQKTNEMQKGETKIAVQDHKPSAFSFTPIDSRFMYLLLTAFDDDNKHAGAVSLLIWEAIKTAKNRGLRYFDFEGSMDPGIAMFFKSFGGEKKSYLHFTNNQSMIWKLKNLVR